MFNVSKLLHKVRHLLQSSVRNNFNSTQYGQLLKNLPQTRFTTLENGLIVATEERECSNSCVGLYINAGSRYESHFENGIAHFFEHIAFKGSNRRTKTKLEAEMSSLGAHFNCFTTREIIGYYAECLNENVPSVVDILSDSLFHNCYSIPEIEQQKCIVYLEMLKHDEDINTLLNDYLHLTAFQGISLAQSVLGKSNNLHNFNQGNISRYVHRLFKPNRTVLAAVGGIKHEQIVSLACTYLNNIGPSKCIDIDEYRFTGSEIRYRNDSLPVANVAVAVEGPSFCDTDKVVMDLAAIVVGGWDRSQPGGKDHPIRVARCASSGDFCDSYKSFHINYKDTGLWGVQFLSSSLKLEDMLYTIQDEWMRMCTIITDHELERAKREMKTKLLSKTESCRGACHEIGRWMLYNGSRPHLNEQLEVIDDVFVDHFRQICYNYIYDKCPAVAAIGTTEGLPEYTRIRAGMYWLRL